jgi:UDP-N-acetylmuramyl pentapeptide phosphotransferase/UDP-N-acetylglucosamine-1-phosphate transferase
MNSLGAGPYIMFAGVFILSALGVAFFRRWSSRHGLLDVPNERSSHSTPTPRGGGLVIVIVALAAYATISVIFGLPVSWGYFVGAALIALVSWLDDLWSLPFWARLIVHVAAAVILTSYAGSWLELTVPIIDVKLEVGKVLGQILAVLWVVWFLNAYNFMDGIDGIAALQAVIAAFAWVALSSILVLPATAVLSGIVASASAGFLIHNWQPARVFMGDVGSAFLGFTLAAMPLMARAEAGGEMPVLPIAGLMFVWFFLFDTVFTLFRRLFGKKRIWEAHREHIYQKLTIEGWRHANVTLIYGAAAAILSLLLLFSILFSGIYSLLAFSFLVLITSLMVYIALRERR